jgi:hypothetical protein
MWVNLLGKRGQFNPYVTWYQVPLLQIRVRGVLSLKHSSQSREFTPVQQVLHIWITETLLQENYET